MTKEQREKYEREVFAAATPEQRAQMLKDKEAREAAVGAAEREKRELEEIQKDIKAHSRTFNDLPEYLPEDKNPNALFLGEQLERGCADLMIGTTGVGKSIHATQLCFAAAGGVPFAGERPKFPMKVMYIESEDSPNRVAKDRTGTLEELMETYPDVNWREAGARVHMLDTPGKTGLNFLDWVEDYLKKFDRIGEHIDFLVINPLLAYIGGPITDGSYVTPFLRGGEMPNFRTSEGENKGFQCILEERAVGARLYHHTPKPPSEKEIPQWLKSAFPEYQGAGSADLVNWVRGAKTLMKLPTHNGFAQITAGKNGSGLGWERIGGAMRYFMTWSGKPCRIGGLRNAWRDLTTDEYAAIVLPLKSAAEKDEAEKKVADIAPYAVKVLDNARSTFLADGRDFQGLTQDAMANAIRNAIIADGKQSFEVRTLKKMLDDLPPDVVIHKGRKPLWYGTKKDLSWHK